MILLFLQDYMDKLKLALKSKTVGVIVVLFFINGLEGVRNLIPPQYLPWIDGILGVLAIWWKLHPSQNYGIKVYPAPNTAA